MGRSSHTGKKTKNCHVFNQSRFWIILFHRSVLGTEFRGELEDTLMITEVFYNLDFKNS